MDVIIEQQLRDAEDLIDAENPAAAIELLNSIETDYPFYIARRNILLGTALSDLGDVEGAKSTWLTIDQSGGLPIYALAQLYLGDLAEENNEFEAAIQHWQNIQKDWELSCYTQAQLNLGELENEGGNVDQAIHHWQVIEKDWDDESYAWAQLYLADAAMAQGD